MPELKVRQVNNWFNRLITEPLVSAEGAEVELIMSVGASLVACSFETGDRVISRSDADHITDGELTAKVMGHQMGAVISSIRAAASAAEVVTVASDNRVVFWRLFEEEGIRMWHPQLFVQLHTQDHEQIVLDAIIPSTTDERELYLVVSSSWRHAENSKPNGSQEREKAVAAYKLVLFDKNTGRVRRKVCDLHRLSVVTRLFWAGFADNGDCDVGATAHEFIVTASNRKLISWSVSNKCGPHTVSPEECGSITSLAVCSRTDIFATGHKTGEICLWYNVSDWLLGKISAPVLSRMHWHSSRVMALAFASEGSFLYSGGNEGVLVVWQTSTGYNNFLPRIGGPIKSIATNSRDARVVVTTLDNSVYGLNTASMRRMWERRGVYIGFDHSKFVSKLGRGLFHSDRKLKFRAIQSPHCISGATVIFCNGAPGELQPIVIPEHDSNNRLTSNTDALQVTGYARVSSKGDPKDRVLVPSVTLFTFSLELGLTSNRHLLATVDVQSLVAEEPLSIRRLTHAASKISLKIWLSEEDTEGRETYSEESTCRYRLVAQIDRPHAHAAVSCLEWMPSHSASLVSGASDGSLKIWCSSEEDFKGWSCVSCLRYRESPCLSLAFSVDASLMAISHGNCLSLWDPISLIMTGQFVAPTSSDIIWASFVEVSVGAVVYLVYATRTCITLLNLLTTEIVWRAFGHYSHFAASSHERPIFANTNIFICCVEEIVDIGNSSYATTDDENSDERNAREAAESVPLKYRVCFYDIASSTPASMYPLAKKPLSLTILRGTPKSENKSVCCVLVSLQNGQVIVLEDAIEAQRYENQLSIDEGAQGNLHILDSTNKALEIVPSTRFFTSLDADKTADVVLATGLSRDLTLKTDMSSVLSLNSQGLPSVSMLFESYMKSLVDSSKYDLISRETDTLSLGLSSNSFSIPSVPESYPLNLKIADFSGSFLGCAGEAMYSHLEQYHSFQNQSSGNVINKKRNICNENEPSVELPYTQKVIKSKAKPKQQDVELAVKRTKTSSKIKAATQNNETIQHEAEQLSSTTNIRRSARHI